MPWRFFCKNSFSLSLSLSTSIGFRKSLLKEPTNGVYSKADVGKEGRKQHSLSIYYVHLVIGTALKCFTCIFN
jgi:hypothetical protein